MEIALFILRIGPALPMIIFGLHQLKHPLDWAHNLPKLLRGDSQKEKQVMLLHASGNIIFGFWLLSGYYLEVVAWIVLIWYAALIPFVWQQKWSSAVRDIAIALPLIALLLLI